LKRLEGRAAFITGGASGMGFSTALLFAREGASIGLCDWNEEKAQAAAKEVRAAGGQCDVILGDIGKEDDVVRMVRQAAEAFGRLDILMNNAAIVGQIGPVVDIDLEQWDESLRVNLTGQVLCAREAVRYMIEQQSGSIINMSSMVARNPFVNRTAYNCCKAALIAFTQTLAKEVGDKGVRVNGILPGVVMTDRLKASIVRHAEAENVPVEEYRKKWQAWSVMNRFVEPEEVSNVVLFLASDESSAMTGQSLNVTAGAIMT